MSLSTALARLEKVSSSASNTADEFIQKMDIPQSVWEVIGQRAAEHVDGTFRRSLIINLQHSGIQRRTGKLERAVRDSQIVFRWQGKTPKLMAFMPTGESGYEQKGKNGKTNKSDFYTVAASLNYGAVRTGRVVRNTVDTATGKITGTKKQSIIGQKAKKTLKKKLLKQKVSKRAEDALKRGYSAKYGSVKRTFTEGHDFGKAVKSTDKSVTSGGGTAKAVVIRPRNFYYLHPVQSKLIGEMFLEKVKSLAYDYVGV